MLVENKQVARAVFFKLFRAQEFEAATRLAAAMFSYSSISLDVSDIDCLIEHELVLFGCKPSIRRNGEISSFNFRGKTDIEPVVWFGKCKDIYE